MKKLLLLLACTFMASIDAMESESDNQTIPLDKQVEVYTVSTIKEFKRFFKTKPDLNKIPHFEFDQLTPDNRVTVLTKATRQHQELKIITDLDLIPGRQTVPEKIFYLKMLQTIKDKLEPIVPADLIYEKKVSTFREFQMFFKKQPDLSTIVRFKFSKLTADERAKVFQEAEGLSQELGQCVTMTIAGEKISGFKLTPEIILFSNMLKTIKDGLTVQLPTE
jgi:hypothetical protein